MSLFKKRWPWISPGVLALVIGLGFFAYRAIDRAEREFKESNTNFTFHDLRHTFGTRLADAGVDVVKIKELLGHASIVTTMRYMHATDRGKRGAITVLSEYRLQNIVARLSQTKPRTSCKLPQV